LEDIENAFMGEGDLLKFRPHRPKNAKTELPSLTFFLMVPSEVITYDLDALLHFPNKGTHNILEVKDLYKKRAELECKSRKIAFNKQKIAADIEGWLNSLFLIDFRKDTQQEKDINDFQSLYLRKAINRGKSQWAIIGEKLRFYLANLWLDVPSENVWKEALELESLLQFNKLEGKARGDAINRFKNTFSEAFSKYSISPQKMLKGKNPSRQMWHVISPNNISEIKSWISIFLKDLRDL